MSARTARRDGLLTLTLLARLTFAASHALPVVDVGPLLRADAEPRERERVVKEIGDACMEVGFFYVCNHGVDASLQVRLEEAFAQFVGLPREEKRQIEMARAGTSWRGYFAVGEELTKGVADQKEGLYFAAEQPGDTRPLHGTNLFPSESIVPGMRDAVTEYMAAMSSLSRHLLTAIGDALSLPREVFAAQFEEPTTLFRCFHYPPHDERWGDESMAVGEHTDSGRTPLPRPPARARSRGCHIMLPQASHAHAVYKSHTGRTLRSSRLFSRSLRSQPCSGLCDCAEAGRQRGLASARATRRRRRVD